MSIKGQDITTYYKADISDLKKGITEANKNIRLAQAEFKAVATRMDNWSKSTDGISAKLKSLNIILTEQKSKLENYKKQQMEMDKAYMENGKRVEELKANLQELADKGVSKTSEEYRTYKRALKDTEQEQIANKKASDDLKTKILEQQGAVNKTEKEIKNYKTVLSEIQSQENKVKTKTEELTDKIEKQQKGLNELKSKYQDVVLKQGKYSTEAKSLAKEIDSLSGELQENKTKMDNASKAADSLDKSLSDIDTETPNKGFTILNGTIANLISSGIKKLASAISGQLGSAISRVDTINSYKKTMQNLGYETEEVTDTTNKLKKGIEGLPTTLPNIMSMQQQYAALSGNIDEATKLTLALNNATLSGGQGQEIANSAMEQWYQIIAKGKPDMQSWTIINSAMPAQMNQIAEAVMGTGKKSQDLFSAWQEGTVTTQSVINALIALDTEGGSGLASFQKQALDASGGIETSMTNVKTAISNGLANIIEAIGTENIAIGFDNIKQAINKVIPKIAEFVGWIVNHKDAIIASVTGIVAAMLTMNVANMIKGVVKSFKTFQKAQEGATVAQWLLNAAMNANPIGIVVALVAGLVAAFVVLWNKSESFRNFWIGLWENIKEVCSSVWEAIKGVFTSAMEKVQVIWNGITGFFSNIWEGIKEIFSVVANWFNSNVIEPVKAFFQPLIDWFINLFQSIWDFIASVFAAISGLAQGCVESIKLIWSIISDWFKKNIIQPVSQFFTSLWNGIKEAARNAWNGIVRIWKTVSSWFNNTIIRPVKNFFTGMWNTLKNGARDAWEGIKNTFSNVTNWFKNVFQKAWEGVKNVFSAGGKIFDGIKEGIANTFKTVVNGIIRGINKVVKIPFDAINGALDKIRNISIAGVSPFEGLPSISVPQIPELERGTVLKKGQVGLLEGNGAEAVVPLERNKYWVKAVADDMKNQLKDNLLNGNTNNISNTNTNTTTNNNFTQNIYAPKQPSRIELYRQTKNLLALKGG